MASFKRVFPQSHARFRIKNVTSCITENYFLPRDGDGTVRIKLFSRNFRTQQKYCKNKNEFRSNIVIWKLLKIKTMYVSIDLFICLSCMWTINQIVNSQIVTQTFNLFIVFIKGIHLTNKKIKNMKEENKKCVLLFWLIIDQTKIYNFHIIWISRPHLVSWLSELFHWKSSLEELPDIYSTSKWMVWCKDGKYTPKNPIERYPNTNRCSFYSTAIYHI